MARKKKQETDQQDMSADLKQEKTEKTGFKGLLKDERVRKITGFIFFVSSIYLFVAFTSYLFTWKADQDQVLKGSYQFLFAMELEVANIMGRLGAWLSHQFFYASFGVSSYLFCSFFFRNHHRRHHQRPHHHHHHHHHKEFSSVGLYGQANFFKSIPSDTWDFDDFTKIKARKRT